MSQVINQPIFIFSAGWRSGSTMLQRMITACGETLVWGEAGGALDRMADAYFSYEQMLGSGGQRFKFGFGGWGTKQYEDFRIAGKEGFNRWIACMNPPTEVFNKSFHTFFQTVYKHPAEGLGYSNWGIKEVQSGVETAQFLRMLYPLAKFVFLVRNPYNCLTSIKQRDWLDRPGDPRALEYYAGHWARLAGEFRQAGFGQLIKYEELITSTEVQDGLGSYLGCVELSSYFKNVNRADWKSQNKKALTFFEKRRLMRIVRDEMKNFGYLS